ncbi:MAG: Coq4 family protein [Cyanobacteria bacterium P01_A01_bin.83]
MAIKFKRLYQAFQAYKKSANLGDFALLKADALGAQANPVIVEKIEQVKGYHPAINLAKLAQLPPGTFGYEYASFMQRNQLKPLNISPELEDVAMSNVFALRYAVTHDMFHVLLGFDTSYAGEIGVLAFAVSQKYSKLQIISLWVARILYPILAPQQFQSILVNLRRGKRMGQQADFLLNYRFEEHWTEPLATLTKKLGLSSKDR